MKCRVLTVLVLFLSLMVSIFGCGKRHVLDGSGMINDLPWKGFTLGRSDSYAQHNFWFTVEEGDFAFYLTGECRDEDGEYVIEEGVEISPEDLQFLKDLWLGDLPDVQPGDESITDMPKVELVLKWMDGSEQPKALPSDVSIEIYERFLPYFRNH